MKTVVSGWVGVSEFGSVSIVVVVVVVIAGSACGAMTATVVAGGGSVTSPVTTEPGTVEKA